jgi:selenocysteine-specific elongation factor
MADARSASPPTSTLVNLRRAPPQVVIGTAGHVDHGKSSLVRALTGTDPDRLPEEKLRGMTIELGFAFLPGADCDLAFIDCPGHERFIAQMVAGAGSIDGCLLVIAADEGPREQSREHLDILKLLGVRWGRVIISKADAVDAATLAATTLAARTLVADSPLAEFPPLAVSVRSGVGMTELKKWLFTQAHATKRQTQGEHVRLPIDRVFTLAGHGTVVTGTLLSGTISIGDTLELYPGGMARVRSLQVNRVAVDQASAGQRTAINVAGIERDTITRGAWLATPGSLRETTRADVRFEVLPIGLKHRQRVELHHGTTTVTGQVNLLHADLVSAGVHDAQIQLSTPLYLRAGDRLVARRPSPSANIAGGIVVDAAAPRHRRFAAATTDYFSAALSGDRLLAYLDSLGPMPAQETDVIAWAGGPGPAAALFAAAGAKIVRRTSGQSCWLWTERGWREAREQLIGALIIKLRAQPERCWWEATALPLHLWPSISSIVGDDIVTAAIDDQQLLRRGHVITAPQAIPPFPQALLADARRLLVMYRTAGLQPPYDFPACATLPDPKRAERALFALRERGWLLQLNDRQHLHRQSGTKLIAEIIAHHGEKAAATIDLLHWLKERHQLTRKYSFPLCDWLDTNHVTKRVGDLRTLGSQTTLAIPSLGEPLE